MSGKRKKHLILSIFMLLPLLAGGLLWGYLHYQSGAFQRAYEHGNTYEQLNSLMNTTRYAKDVRKAGYEIDSYGLKMNGRIDTLETKTDPAVIISVPTKEGVIARISINEDEDIMLSFNKKMGLRTVSYGKGERSFNDEEVPEEILYKYKNFTLKAMQDLTKDVYDSMYPD